MNNERPFCDWLIAKVGQMHTSYWQRRQLVCTVYCCATDQLMHYRTNHQKRKSVKCAQHYH